MSRPKDLQDLRLMIIERHDELSPRLRQVAAYILDHPNEMGLETQAEIARRCGVQPPTIVRFAKAFGYDGASQMQRLFRNELINATPSPSYAERIRQANLQNGGGQPLTPHELMQEFAASNIIALGHIQETITPNALNRAVDLLEQATAVHVCGLRRSFPVAVWMAYALRHVDKIVHLIDGIGGMLNEQGSMIAATDLLFAVSFRPYAKETVEIVARARQIGASVVSISDSPLSPVSREADVSFDINDAEVRQFRSLTGSMCIAQTLVMSYAQRIEQRPRNDA
jgi:DNA-binding MurR/RpiR family transcriptional regulator